METYKAISAQITPIKELSIYHPLKKSSDSVWDNCIIGYRAVIIFDWEFEDGNTMVDYMFAEFATIESAKKWLSQQYTNN